MNYAVSDFDDIQTIFKQAELPAPLCIDYYKLGSDYGGNDIAQKISAAIDEANKAGKRVVLIGFSIGYIYAKLVAQLREDVVAIVCVDM